MNRNTESIMELARGSKYIPNGYNWLKFYAAIMDTANYSCKYGRWNRKDDNYLIKNYEVLGAKNISKRLNRTEQAIIKRVSELKRKGEFY